MYTLTLTAADRKAIWWIGDRYAHGYDLYTVLWCQSDAILDHDWDDDCDITFTMPEYVAWEVEAIGKACAYRWDCFSPKLANKLNEFCEKVV